MNELMRRLLDLPPQASSYARAIDTLHYFVISATMLGATFVFLLALYYVLRYGRRGGPDADVTPHLETTAFGETFIVVGTLGLFLVFWVVGSQQYDHMVEPPRDAMTIHVTAKQWMWKFSYPDGRATMDELVVPVGRPVELVMTSRDVIHSFYVPQFRMKHDVVPGRYYSAWFTAVIPGTFDIFCAEYCGVGHSRMSGRVRALDPSDYAAWLAQPVERTADMVTQGRDVAARRGCFNCHTIDGQPHVGPSWAGLYESWVDLDDGRRVFADAGYLTESMMDPAIKVVAGYKPVMPTYRGVLPQPEVAALVEYIVSLRDRPYAPSVILPKVTP